MGDVVNLNAYRKRQEREAIKDKAAENRTRHGRKRTAKRSARQDKERSEADLDAKRLDAEPTGNSADDPKPGA